MIESLDFSIKYSGNGFLVEDGGLPESHRKYLRDYLSKIARYRPIASWEGSPVYSLYQPPVAAAAGRRALAMRLRRKFEGLRAPASATISVTGACQCDCAHCSAEFYNKSGRRPLDGETLKRALRETVDLGATTIILLGGEPLLRKDLFEIVASIPKERATTILFTNGEFLTAENCERLRAAGLLGAFVSIDSGRPEEHDAARARPGLFEKAMQGIANLNRHGLVSGISSYLSPERLAGGGFEEILELGRKHEVREVTFFDAIPSGRWLRDESHLLGPGDRRRIRELAKDYRNRSGYPGLSIQSLLTAECGSAFCFAANTQFYLTAFGDMCPCDFTPLTVGSYPAASIAGLWREMTSSSPYNRRAKTCRMQDADFRRTVIDKIPAEGPFPYPIQSLALSRS